jgi:hypothetical protein
MGILAASFQEMQCLFDFFSLPQTHYFSILRNHRFRSNGAWRQIFNPYFTFPPKKECFFGGNHEKSHLSAEKSQ